MARGRRSGRKCTEMLNTVAPDFSLPDSEGVQWKLSDHRGKAVVILFYPGDETPVCTKQLCSVRDNWERYALTGAEVIGISTDSAESHGKFSSKYGLPLRLLSDEKGEVVSAYGVKSWIPGRSARAVVIVGKDGRIAHYKIESLSLFRPDDEEIIRVLETLK